MKETYKWVSVVNILKLVFPVVVITHLASELFNLLINPEAHDFALRWHRDDVREKATEEEERVALDRWGYGVCLNSEDRRNASC